VLQVAAPQAEGLLVLAEVQQQAQQQLAEDQDQQGLPPLPGEQRQQAEQVLRLIGAEQQPEAQQVQQGLMELLQQLAVEAQLAVGQGKQQADHQQAELQVQDSAGAQQVVLVLELLHQKGQHPLG
jgi:hypothetical protein